MSTNFRGGAPLKTVSINQHLNKTQMDKQLSIDDKVMKNGISSKYRFTSINHFEIIDIIEKERIRYNLSKTEISNLAGVSNDHYSGVSTYSSRFSMASYNAYRIAIDKLKSEIKPKQAFTPIQPNPTYRASPPNPSPIDTLEQAIAICKANGLKVSKSETITNWIEL
jgi:hypothetical protein